MAEAVADCSLVVGTTAVRHRELQHPLKTPAEGAPLIRNQLVSSRVALLFGSEKRGLSKEDLSHCHWLMRIPAREEHISMNLGQAVAVCLYELARDKKTHPVASRREGNPPEKEEKLELANAGEIERITALLLEALRASGYVKPDSVAPTEEKIRRLVRRLNLQGRDAEVLLGMLRQIAWKLRTKKE